MNNPKFCDSKICPAGVARQNPIRILSACKVIPDFPPRDFVRPQNLGYPAKQDKLDESLSLRPLVIARGGFFCRKIRDNLRRAFTLIELLLALSIFSMVALCVYGTFWAGVRLNQRSEGETAAYHQVRLALELLSVDLENAVPYDFTNSYPGKTAFTGENDVVTFLLATGKGLKVIRYYLDSPQEGSVHKVVVGARHDRNVDTLVDYREQEVRLRDLVREEWDFPEYVSGVIAKDHAAEVIAANVREDSLKFSYGYLLSAAGSEGNKTSDVYEWREAWTGSNLPLMVRIEMDFLLTGPAQRVITMRKDVFIPHGSPGSGEPGNLGKPGKI